MNLKLSQAKYLFLNYTSMCIYMHNIYTYKFTHTYNWINR